MFYNLYALLPSGGSLAATLEATEDVQRAGVLRCTCITDLQRPSGQAAAQLVWGEGRVEHPGQVNYDINRDIFYFEMSLFFTNSCLRLLKRFTFFFLTGFG